MLIVAMLGCGLLGVVIERFAYRPLRNAPRIAPLISALGVSFFIQNSVLLRWGATSVPTTRSTSSIRSTAYVGPLNVWMIRLLVIAAAFAMMVAVC